MITIDARGLSCPQPVLLTKQALDAHPEGCRVLVDAPAAKANVTRYAQKAGFNVDVSEQDNDTVIDISK